MRLRKVVLGTTLLASLFILMAGLVLATWYAREGDSISRSPARVSAYADVAASESGQQYVAVVWTERSSGHDGELKLRWGTPDEGWQWPITTIESEASRSREPAVAVYGDTAYIAYTKRSGTNWVIGYVECSYGGSCSEPTTVYASVNESGSADIAFCNNTRHVVWADTTTGPSDEIRYSSSGDGTTWTGATAVTSSGDNINPAVACYGSTAYVAWIEDIGQTVQYANSSNWGTTQITVWTGGVSNSPYNTSIAVYGNYADVVWDFKDTSDHFYVRQWRKILPNGSACTNEIPDASSYYTSTYSTADPEYLRYLRPAITVYSDTAYAQPVPVVVWHSDINSTHEVMYSRGVNFGGNCDVLTWSDPILLTGDFSLFKGDCSTSSVAMGISGTVTRTHVVFQKIETGDQWDIYYTSDISSTLTQSEPAHANAYLPVILKSY